MTILLGIIGFHFLVMARAKQTSDDGVPYITTFLLTAFLVVYVIAWLYVMEPPTQ